MKSCFENSVSSNVLNNLFSGDIYFNIWIYFLWLDWFFIFILFSSNQNIRTILLFESVKISSLARFFGFFRFCGFGTVCCKFLSLITPVSKRYCGKFISKWLLSNSFKSGEIKAYCISQVNQGNPVPLTLGYYISFQYPAGEIILMPW